MHYSQTINDGLGHYFKHSLLNDSEELSHHWFVSSAHIDLNFQRTIMVSLSSYVYIHETCSIIIIHCPILDKLVCMTKLMS